MGFGPRSRAYMLWCWIDMQVPAWRPTGRATSRGVGGLTALSVATVVAHQPSFPLFPHSLATDRIASDTSPVVLSARCRSTRRVTI
jgi:hypothetical protein